jgi:hypothetical protein
MNPLLAAILASLTPAQVTAIILELNRNEPAP